MGNLYCLLCLLTGTFSAWGCAVPVQCNRVFALPNFPQISRLSNIREFSYFGGYPYLWWYSLSWRRFAFFVGDFRRTPKVAENCGCTPTWARLSPPKPSPKATSRLPESNQRPYNGRRVHACVYVLLQSYALPTELSREVEVGDANAASKPDFIFSLKL